MAVIPPALPYELLPLTSQYHFPFETPNPDWQISLEDCAAKTAFKFPSEKVIAVLPAKGFNIAKLFVQVSVDWSVAAIFTSVKSVPPFASLPKLLLSSKSK